MSKQDIRYYENIIIGAGPAGIQCAYYFKKYNINYIVLEKNASCGSFFQSYPLTGKLISINKKYNNNNNADFNLRHDWNSLLNDEKLLFTDYSEDYYPDRNSLTEYLQAFYESNRLNILFNQEVTKISYGIEVNLHSGLGCPSVPFASLPKWGPPDSQHNESGFAQLRSERESSFSMPRIEVNKAKNKNVGINISSSIDEEVCRKDLSVEKYQIYCNNTVYVCKKLIVATGLSKKNIPNVNINIVDEIKHYGDYDKNYFMDRKNLDEFKQKTVMIVGGGNASYELANILNNNIASRILILCKKYGNWGMTNHYSGNIRSIYLPFMDTFFLKSLNAIDTYDFSSEQTKIEQKLAGGSYVIYNKETKKIYGKFDKIIFCTGWRFDNTVFDFDIEMTHNNKYPCVKNNFESTNCNNLYFIGSLMHSIDYRKSSGGFIHGFRYLIKLFISLNYNIPFDIDLFDLRRNYCEIDSEILTNYILERLNTTSDLYQMYGVLCDIFFYNKREQQIIYYKNIMENNITIEDNTIIKFCIKLEFGNKNTDIDILGKKQSSLGSECNSDFIHPVIYIYEKGILLDIFHFDEDLFADFTCKERYHDKLLRLIKSYFL